jgi:hypothetical protein
VLCGAGTPFPAALSSTNKALILFIHKMRSPIIWSQQAPLADPLALRNESTLQGRESSF